MKTLNKLLLGTCLLVGLVSCEMKDELFEKGEISGDTGVLSLGVSTNDETNVITKADAGDATINQFPVKIYNSENKIVKEYAYYSEVENEIRLLVGTYLVEAMSPGEFETRMSQPYFAGEESFEIKKNSNVEVDLVCKVQNIPVSLSLEGNFTTEFKEWSIILDDGKNSTLKFKSTDEPPYSAYWKVGENVSTINVNILATTLDGEKVSRSYSCTKSSAEEDYIGDSEFFGPGDKIVIKLSPEETDVEVGVTIGITVDLGFENADETVEIPVEEEGTSGGVTDPDPDEPEEPGTEEPITISDNGTGYLTNGVDVVAPDYPDNVKISMNAKEGIQNVFVKVESTNETFKGIVAELHLTDGDGMDLAGDEAASLGELFTLPDSDGSSYEFSMNSMLFGLLGNYEGTHTFTLKLVDDAGNYKSAQLVIRLTK